MYNPKQILTEAGYRRYMAHIENMRAACEFLANYNDDLHTFNISEEEKYDDFFITSDQKLSPIPMDYELLFYKFQDFIDRLEDGPFEDEDKN